MTAAGRRTLALSALVLGLPLLLIVGYQTLVPGCDREGAQAELDRITAALARGEIPADVPLHPEGTSWEAIAAQLPPNGDVVGIEGVGLTPVCVVLVKRADGTSAGFHLYPTSRGWAIKLGNPRD